MPRSLKGSDVETCSCDPICPGNASMPRGAVYDDCGVVFPFASKDGEVEGTAVSGLTVAAVADTPSVETARPVRFDGMFHPIGSNLTIAQATRSKINAFGIECGGRPGSRPPSSPGPPEPWG